MPISYEQYRKAYSSLRPDAPETEVRKRYEQDVGGPGFWDSLGSGLAYGGYQTLAGFGSLGEIAGLPTGEWADEMAQAAQPYALPENLQGSVVDRPELLSDPAWLAHNIGNVGPSIVASILPGLGAAGLASKVGMGARAARIAGAAGSGLSGGGLEAGHAYREHGDVGRALAYGGASAALNALPAYRLLGPLGRAGRLGKTAATGLTEGATEWAEEPVEAAIHGEDITQAMKEGVNVLPGSIVAGMLTGGAASLAQSPQQQETRRPYPVRRQPIDRAAPLTAEGQTEYSVDVPAAITAEAVPSTSTPEGMRLSQAPESVKADLNRAALGVMRDEQGNDTILQAIAEGRQQEGVGTFEGAISPNVVTEVTGDPEAADLYSLAWMSIWEQDGVPWFRPTTNGNITGMVVKPQNPGAEFNKAFYEHLQKYVEGGEFTAFGDELVALNFTDMADEDFVAAMERATEDFDMPITERRRITAEGKYHDISEYAEQGWANPEEAQQALEDAISRRGRSDLLPRVRDRRQAAREVFAQAEEAPQLSEAEELTPEELHDRAAEEFGTTDSLGDTGYILPDGRMLDFSEGGGMGRTLDHRAVGDMRAFEESGAIRWSPEAWGAEIAGDPTRDQLEVLAEASQERTLILDINDQDGRLIDSIDVENATAQEIERRIFAAQGYTVGEPEVEGGEDYPLSEVGTEEDRRLAKEALQALGPGRGRARVLGSDLPSQFRETGKVDLIGQQVRSAEDLAELAQVYRDPRFETFRVFFTRGDTVVDQTGVTSRLPGSTASFVGNIQSKEQFNQKITEMDAHRKRIGADGYFLLHNHPSGTVVASKGDKGVTASIAGQVPGFRGHVIIDHDQYGVIDVFDATTDPEDRRIGVRAGEFEREFDLKTYDFEHPTKPHPLLQFRIASPVDIASAAKAAQQSEDQVVIIAHGNRGVTGIAEASAESLNTPAKAGAMLRRFARQHGGANAFMANVPPELFDIARDAVRNGFAADAVTVHGESTRVALMEAGEPTPRARFGKENQIGMPAEEETEYEPEMRSRARTENASDLAFDAKRRVQTNEATQALADALGTTPEEVEKFMRRKLGTSFNAEQLVQSAEMVEQEWQKDQQLFKALAQKMEEGELTDNDLAEAYEAMLDLTALSAQFMGVRGEAGRALQVFNNLQATTSRVEAMNKVMDWEGGKDMLRAKIAALSELEEPGTGVRATREAMEVTRWDQFVEFWINSLVSGIPTHVVNTVSNTFQQVMQDMDRIAAAGIGALHGGDKVTFGEAVARIGATLTGTRAGITSAAQAFQTEDQFELFGKIDVARKKAIPGVLGKAVRIPTRFLGAEDVFFKTMAVQKELAALAHRESQKTGVSAEKLMANPSQEMLDKAWHEAEEATFTRRSGSVGKAIQRLLNAHPWLRIIVPFVRTPGNIMRQALQRTPAAFAFKEVREAMAKGGVERDMAVARITVGSGIMVSAISLAAQGLISGQPPEDTNERRRWYLLGNQPNSIRVGDTWVSFSRFEPLGMLLGIAADMYQFADRMGDDEAGKIGNLLIGSLFSNLASKTYLRGISEVIRAMDDPERYGERWLSRLGGTMAIPTMVAYVARAGDDRMRKAEGLMDSIRARVPGQKSALPERLDVFGRPIKEEAPGAYRFFSPAYVETVKSEPAVEELQRLDVNLPMPPDRFRGVELTPEEHNDLVRTLGAPMRQALNHTIRTQLYQQAPDPLKKWMLDRVINSVRDDARLYWTLKHPEIMREAQQKKLEEYRP